MSTVKCAEKPVDKVPDTFVDITLFIQNINLPITGSIILTNQNVNVTTLGYDNNGIVVYRADEYEFYAYDRTCPYHIEKSTAVNLVNNLIVECPYCHSLYLLNNYGYPTDAGPSKYPLKEYQADYNPNTATLHIYNY